MKHISMLFLIGASLSWNNILTYASVPSSQECPTQDLLLQPTPPSPPPYVEPRLFRQGTVLPPSSSEQTPLSPVFGCCSKEPIGQMPQMSTSQSQEILADAIQGWNGGAGVWTQFSLSERMTYMKQFIQELHKQREEIIKVLMWEIGKNVKDATAEFDRTIQFIQMTLETLESSPLFNALGTIQEYGSATRAFVRRNALGIILCLGPYNYPLNETYATLIPALLMGNVVILKIPTLGGLSHLLTFEAFAKALPPNTIHFISGSGRKTLPPLMESGKIDGLAFIGGTNAADNLIKLHPQPHRLKLFLQLEAKNMAILYRNFWESDSNSDTEEDGSYYTLDQALDEVITGALSYNGQRCTALKIVFVPKGKGALVAKELSKRVQNLRIGMPWQTFGDDGSQYSQITPLPNEARINVMKSFMEDAASKGSSIMNADGGTILDLVDSEESSIVSTSNLMVPSVMFPVTPDMELYREEQFGPIIPVAEYDPDTLEEILTFAHDGDYGQQVSIFTKSSSAEISFLVDQFSSVFGKVNLNSQCGRSPDILPFSARRSSGLGVMSVEDALREFSVPTVVAYKTGKDKNIQRTVEEIQSQSKFMSSIETK